MSKAARFCDIVLIPTLRFGEVGWGGRFARLRRTLPTDNTPVGERNPNRNSLLLSTFSASVPHGRIPPQFKHMDSA